MKDFLNAFDRLISPLKTRITQIISRGVLELSNDEADLQKLQVSFSEEDTQNDILRFQNFGFSSNPPDNSDVIILNFGGSRAQSIAIAVEHRGKRKKGLGKGESTFYNAFGSSITLKKDGIEISNGKDELIHTLVDLAKKVEDLKSALQTATYTTPAGSPLTLTFLNPIPDFSGVSQKLEGFQS